MEPTLNSTSAIQRAFQVTDDGWFEYPIHVYPHHTDYGGIAWHGAYVAWMEEARVAYLGTLGIQYADLVAMGCELPVVDLSIRYHRSLRMGDSAVLKTRTSGVEGVRLVWDYQILSPDSQDLYVSAQVTLVAVDREKGKIMRQLPPMVKNALMQLAT